MILVKPSFEILEVMALSTDEDNPLRLIELAGRTCYKSEERMNVESAKKFVRMVIVRGHHSVIEHSAMTVKFICDRGVTHELVRHRLCAFSQESTIYVNYKGGCAFIIPPWTNISEQESDNVADLVSPLYEEMTGSERTWIHAILTSEAHYKSLIGDGWSPQQARSVLPNSTKTEIVVTANFREWRHIFRLRCSKAAHPQMREIMIPLHKVCKGLVPIIFDDIEYDES